MEESLKNLVLCASLCNTATIHKGDENKWEANGDATEIALQVFAHKLGHGQPHLTHQKKSHQIRSKGEALSPVTTRTSETAVKPAKIALEGHYTKIVEHPFDSCVSCFWCLSCWPRDRVAEHRLLFGVAARSSE